MASSNRLGDIPGARFTLAPVANASVASGGGNALIGQLGPLPYDVALRDAWWTPTGGDNTATSTASYRKLTIVDGGVDGTGTVVLASLGLTASAPSLKPVAFGSISTVKLASGHVLMVSQATVGAADSTDTVLKAGQTNLDYEVL